MLTLSSRAIIRNILQSHFIHLRVQLHSFCGIVQGREQGGPQGSCAGVQMYSVGTDDIDDTPSIREQPDWSHEDRQPGPISSSEDEDSGAQEPIAGPSVVRISSSSGSSVNWPLTPHGYGRRVDPSTSSGLVKRLEPSMSSGPSSLVAVLGAVSDISRHLVWGCRKILCCLLLRWCDWSLLRLLVPHLQGRLELGAQFITLCRGSRLFCGCSE